MQRAVLIIFLNSHHIIIIGPSIRSLLLSCVFIACLLVLLPKTIIMGSIYVILLEYTLVKCEVLLCEYVVLNSCEWQWVVYICFAVEAGKRVPTPNPFLSTTEEVVKQRPANTTLPTMWKSTYYSSFQQKEGKQYNTVIKNTTSRIKHTLAWILFSTFIWL